MFTHGMGLRSIDVQNNRGDGGQNEIGRELFRDIAVLRTAELLSAHRIDGAEKYFTRVIEYGYSFDPQEVIQKWVAKISSETTCGCCEPCARRRADHEHSGSWRRFAPMKRRRSCSGKRIPLPATRRSLIHLGTSIKRSVVLNRMVGSTSAIGALFVLFMGDRSAAWTKVLPPFTTANFIYVASVGLMPKLQRELGIGPSIMQAGFLVLGCLLMLVVSNFVSD